MDMVETRDAGKPLTVSVIIPTKNRGETIMPTVESIVAQSLLPDELVIVDQSETNHLADPLNEIVAGTGIKLAYLWRPDLTGLAQARNVGFDVSAGEIVLFFDDDVFLETDYIERLLWHYQNDHEGRLGGVGGLITNEQRPEARAFKWFQRGPFDDTRPPFQANPVRRFRTTALKGSNMSYRRAAYDCTRANETLKGYSGGEDWELGQRVSKRFELILTSDARLEHRKSPINRQSERTILANAIQCQLDCYRNLYSSRERRHPKMWLADLWFRGGMSIYGLARLRQGDFQFAKSTVKAAWRTT
jgi:glycosyltransferase involved in cell wall biosynthesis